MRKNIKVVYSDLTKHEVWGLAHFDKNIVELHNMLKGKKHLEILIHETLHLVNPFHTEEKIVEDAIVITNILWNQQYRRIDNSNKIPLQNGKK